MLQQGFFTTEGPFGSCDAPMKRAYFWKISCNNLEAQTQTIPDHQLTCSSWGYLFMYKRKCRKPTEKSPHEPTYQNQPKHGFCCVLSFISADKTGSPQTSPVPCDSKAHEHTKWPPWCLHQNHTQNGSTWCVLKGDWCPIPYGTRFHTLQHTNFTTWQQFRLVLSDPFRNQSTRRNQVNLQNHGCGRFRLWTFKCESLSGLAPSCHTSCRCTGVLDWTYRVGGFI